MSREDRFRVVLVSLLAVGVMGGVVASALIARRSSSADSIPVRHDDPSAADKKSRSRTEREPLPPDCEVDPKNPPALSFVDVPQDRLDLGPMKQGEELDREVVVRNTGRGLLCVQDVESGCGCIKGKWTGDKRVPPSASGILKIHVNTAGREGVVDKSIRLFTNDPARKVAELKVRLEVRRGIVATSVASGGNPSALSFGQRRTNQSGTARVRLKSPIDEPDWQILGVESMEPKAIATTYTWAIEEVESKDPRTRVRDLVVTHPGRGDAGNWNERVRVRTSHPERPEILLDGSIYVVPKYYTGIKRAGFGFVRPKAPTPTKTIYVMPGDASSTFVVKGAVVEGVGFVAQPPRAVKEGWAVDVRYDGQPRKLGPVKATLVVSIDDAEMPEVRVPLEAQVTGE